VRLIDDGEHVAATLGCYARDAFIQQAPEAAVAVASADLAQWTTRDLGEFVGKVTREGSTFRWRQDVAWDPDHGWTRH